MFVHNVMQIVKCGFVQIHAPQMNAVNDETKQHGGQLDLLLLLLAPITPNLECRMNQPELELRQNECVRLSFCFGQEMLVEMTLHFVQVRECGCFRVAFDALDRFGTF